MHSRIYQIGSTPIEKEDYINESDFYENSFVGEVADYVNDSTDRADDLDWLKSYCGDDKGITIDIENGTIVINDKRKYFSEIFDKFKELLNKLSEEATLEAFARLDKSYWGLSSTLYDLDCTANGDKFGFYVYDMDDNGYITRFDEFLRYAEEGKTYYFGGTIDYHS